jgi:hypothetical protein
MAELKQALLGRLAGGVDGVNAAAPTSSEQAGPTTESETRQGNGPASSAWRWRPTPRARRPLEPRAWPNWG